MLNSQFNEQMQSWKFYRSSGNSKKKQKIKSWLKIEFIILADHTSSVWCLRSLCFGIPYSLGPWASIIHLVSSFPQEGYPIHLSFLKSKLPWKALSPLTQFIRTACPHHSSWQGTHIRYRCKCHPPASPNPTAEQHDTTSQPTSPFQVQATVHWSTEEKWINSSGEDKALTLIWFNSLVW